MFNQILYHLWELFAGLVGVGGGEGGVIHLGSSFEWFASFFFFFFSKSTCMDVVYFINQDLHSYGYLSNAILFYFV